MLKRSRPPARKEKAHSRVESAACYWAGVEAQKRGGAEAPPLVYLHLLRNLRKENSKLLVCEADRHSVIHCQELD